MFDRLIPWAASLVLVLSLAQAEDWPTYQHDIRRSGWTSERLEASQLGQQWRFESSHPPQPAWDGPAKWDAYAGIRGLKSMRNYDPVFHVTVAGQSLFFGSSVDDAVHCLDTRTGKEKWFFPTDGPVRIAPTFHEGRVFFGSDDGYAYCVDAAEGRLIWKYRPAEEGRLVLCDGRFIPFWPCRSGVLVDGGTAYFAMGMLPWKESFLCAVDAVTGRPDGSGRFVRRLQGVTLEGAIVASSQRLICPQGRVAPLLFNRNDGKQLGSLEGGGGCFVLVTEDSRVLHGPGNKTGWIQESAEKNRAKLATFEGGNALVVDDRTAYLLKDDALVAMDRVSRKEIWTKPCDCPHTLIQAGDTLFAGGTDRVAAFRTQDGALLWEKAVKGRVFGLVVADGALFVSTDDGCIYCYRVGQKETPASVAQVPATGTSLTNHARLSLAIGPSLRFNGEESAEVWWRTATPLPTVLDWGMQGGTYQRVFEAGARTNHQVTLTGLRRDRVYSYLIRSDANPEAPSTLAYECDTLFNYSVPSATGSSWPISTPTPDPSCGKLANEILSVGKVTEGIVLLLGCDDGGLGFELAKRSRLRVLAVDPDASKVARVRRAWMQTGLYGSRLTVRHVPSWPELPFTPHFASLVVSTGTEQKGAIQLEPSRVASMVKPFGGVGLVGGHLPAEPLNSWREGYVSSKQGEAEVSGGWLRMTVNSPAGAGEWSHEYGTAANTAFGGEDLRGASNAGDLEVQWLGRPGPRFQADRNGRKPSPLAVQGRLFVQGLQRICALDAYNGTILWTREIPSFLRFNMPRDCSNWAADRDSLYLAIEGLCWRLEAASGEVSCFYPVQKGRHPDWDYDWGYLSVQTDSLIGSAVRKGSSYQEYWGKADEGWYDAKSGPATYKVCSENLFALDRATGQAKWQYAQGIILNPTITIEGNRLYFLESRHPQVLASTTHRIGIPELWRDLFLVALDLTTGKPVWEQSIQPAVGEVVVYLTAGQGALALVCSGGDKYNVMAFSREEGRTLWKSSFPWTKGDHGGHMARPAIVGKELFVRPRAFDLVTGKVLDKEIPGGGCGTYAASERALFFRDSTLTMWSIEHGKVSTWDRLRPDCWLSTVPALGLLLSPEAGGGCSCGNWMETSIVFAPR